MRILLLSQNHTVQGMVSLALRDIENATLETVDTVNGINTNNYDWIFIDDTVSRYQETLKLVEHLDYPQTVLFHHPNNVVTEGFDILIKKPFLPAEISTLLKENRTSKNGTTEPDEVKIKKKKKKKSKTQVLDIDEIETIKALLEEDGLEIISEENMIEDKITRKKSSKKEKKKKLLKALKEMKPKKIRKLLKGAKIKIKIKFPKDK